MRINTFCCCCNLKTGSLVIGTVGWLLSVAYVGGIFHGDTFEWKDSFYITVALSVLALTGYITLVYGIYQDNHDLIMLWLALSLLACCVASVSLCGYLLVLYHDRDTYISFIFRFVSTVLNWYCWICVWSYYKELEETTVKKVEVTKTTIELKTAAPNQNEEMRYFKSTDELL